MENVNKRGVIVHAQKKYRKGIRNYTFVGIPLQKTDGVILYIGVHECDEKDNFVKRIGIVHATVNAKASPSMKVKLLAEEVNNASIAKKLWE